MENCNEFAMTKDHLVVSSRLPLQLKKHYQLQGIKLLLLWRDRVLIEELRQEKHHAHIGKKKETHELISLWLPRIV